MNKSSEIFSIYQVLDRNRFDRYQKSIKKLLEFYQSVLLDDACEFGCEGLLENLRASLPHVWIVIQGDRVVALCNLTDEIEGRHVFIHGLSYPDVWQTGCQTEIAMMVMQYAFEKLQVLKIKAEFEVGNKTAKGFCFRYGFKKEGHFKNDTRVNGKLCDVVIYSLPRAQFQTLAASYYSDTPNQKETEHVIRT